MISYHIICDMIPYYMMSYHISYHIISTRDGSTSYRHPFFCTFQLESSKPLRRGPPITDGLPHKRPVSLQWRHNGHDSVSNHQTQIKENIKAPRHWPLWGELIPRTNGQLRGKCFHSMTSSWYRAMMCPMLLPCGKSSRVVGKLSQHDAHVISL